MTEHLYSYDPECEKLARHFLPHGSEAAIRELSQALQDTVEAFEFEPTDPHHGGKIY